ncbi:MAG: SufE family protein [Limisphaerales bacterium]
MDTKRSVVALRSDAIPILRLACGSTGGYDAFMSADAAVTTGLAARRDALLARLGAFPHPQERLQWLVEQARLRPALAPEFKTEAHRVPGCLANLWLVAESRAGRCHFQCDSDSQIVRAVAGLLCDFYSEHTAVEILAVEPGFLDQVGINQHLTANRRNVLSRVWGRIRAFAEERKEQDQD